MVLWSKILYLFRPINSSSEPLFPSFCVLMSNRHDFPASLCLLWNFCLQTGVQCIVIGPVDGGERINFLRKYILGWEYDLSEKQECDIAQNRTAEVFGGETKTFEFNVCGIRHRLKAWGRGFHNLWNTEKPYSVTFLLGVGWVWISLVSSSGINKVKSASLHVLHWPAVEFSKLLSSVSLQESSGSCAALPSSPISAPRLPLVSEPPKPTGQHVCFYPSAWADKSPLGPAAAKSVGRRKAWKQPGFKRIVSLVSLISVPWATLSAWGGGVQTQGLEEGKCCSSWCQPALWLKWSWNLTKIGKS